MIDRKYVQIPGTGSHELPPLLVRGVSEMTSREEVVAMAADIVEGEDMIISPAGGERDALIDFEQRKFDLALHLADQYRGLLSHWIWGDSILEWIRQCETTFEVSDVLRTLLHPDVWPHAGRSSFVTLLADKAVPTHGVGIEKAVGLRLTFRQPPPIECFSNQFLVYLNTSVADGAYHAWSELTTESPALLPPDRFYFQVHELN